MNLWDIVTDNSSLPIQPGNNFWDHLNNQQGRGPVNITVYEQTTVFLMPELEVTLEDEMSVQLEEEFVIELEKELIVEVC